MHLPSRLDALRRLASAARPGGWVLNNDPDFTTVTLQPPSAAWERTWSAFLDAAVAGGWDPRYGARLAGDMRAVGLTEVHPDYVATATHGGALPLLALTIERLRPRMLAQGAADDEIDEAERLLADPANTVTSPTICAARGRLRPYSQPGVSP